MTIAHRTRALVAGLVAASSLALLVSAAHADSQRCWTPEPGRTVCLAPDPGTDQVFVVQDVDANPDGYFAGYNAQGQPTWVTTVSQAPRFIPQVAVYYKNRLNATPGRTWTVDWSVAGPA